MFRHYFSFGVPLFVGITLAALTASAIAGMNLNNGSKAISESESLPLTAQAVWRPSRIEAVPLQGFNIDFGTKYAIGYYKQADEGCKVVLTYAEPMNWDAHPIHVTTRLETTLAAEEWTSYMSHEGASLQFNCGSGARTLRIKALPRQYGG